MSIYEELVHEVNHRARPLAAEDTKQALLSRTLNTQAVLIGEASHGTHEFYQWRADFTKDLITEQGYQFVAVEGDWPACYEVNRYVKGYDDAPPDARSVVANFTRWPTWMWANQDVLEFIGWLRDYNLGRSPLERVGFYGLDVYSLWESLTRVLDYLHQNNPDHLNTAYQAFYCFEPFGHDAREYGYATRLIDTSCEEEVIALLQELHSEPTYHGDPEERFSAEQNALVAQNAEHYYRTMVQGGPVSWNVRDQHMMETFSRLLEFYAEQSLSPAVGKGIVWAHNTHVGDARSTDMMHDELVNIGQLARSELGSANVYLIGQTSYVGTVTAGSHWGGAAQEMDVPVGRPESWEDVLHQIEPEEYVLIFDEASRRDPLWGAMRGHRAIGVVYNPQREHYNYEPTNLSERYDALIFFAKSHALTAFEENSNSDELPETYPSGV
jgi:erythromycin esterase-like protein